MLKTLLITLAILGVVATIGAVWARQNGYCASGDFSQHISQRVSRKLDLNDEQSGKLQGFAETLRRLRGDWEEHRTQRSDEIEHLLAVPSLDRDRSMELLAERKREIVDAFADFTDSLQPDQRARLAELIVERMQHRWGPTRWAY